MSFDPRRIGAWGFRSRAAILVAGALIAAGTPAPPFASKPSTTSAAVPPVPDTPAGRRFADLMQLTDAGDTTAMTAYVAEHFGPGMQAKPGGDPGIAPFLVGHVKQFGGFVVARAIATDGDQVTMLVRPRNQENRWIRYIVKVEEAPPHRVEGLFLMPASPGDIPQQGEGLAPEEAVAAFAREVDRAIAEGEFSGVVLLARGDTPVLERVAGLADRARGRPVTRETLFGLASLNKMFTAAAIGRLVDAGVVGWDDPVGEHLNGWLAPEHATRITIRDLLTHTSGLGDYLDAAANDPAIREARSLAAYREFVRTSAIEEVPPGRLRYSNAGYVVLGALIESVTQRDYFDFVREEVFGPAGMRRTDSWAHGEAGPEAAVGYSRTGEPPSTPGGGEEARVAPRRGARGTSAGGGWSTAGDLLQFARAFAMGRIVSPATREEILAPRVRFPTGGHYGFGFVIHEGADGRRIYGHSGGIEGVGAELKVYGDGEWTLVVLSNVTGGAGELVGSWDGIAARLERK